MLAWTQSPVTASEHQVTANLGSQSQVGITYHFQLLSFQPKKLSFGLSEGLIWTEKNISYNHMLRPRPSAVSV